MTKFVLLLAIWSYNGTTSSMTNEYNSLSACQTAAENFVVKAEKNGGARYVAWDCSPK